MPNTLTMRIRFQHIHVGRDTNIQYITTNREERGMLNELTVKDGLNIVLKRFKEYGMPNSVTPIIMIFVHVVDICMGRLCSILLTAAVWGEGNTCDFHFLNIPIIFELLKIDIHYPGKEEK